MGGPVVSAIAPGSPLVSLCGWIGLNFLIFPIGILYQFLLQKNQRFRRIAIVESAARCAGTATVVLLALRQQGVFSYVAGQVVYNSVKSGLLLFAGFRFMPLSFELDVSAVRPYLRFGLYQMGERVINFFAANVDYMIIGRFLGTRELGYYKVAYELVTVPQRLINPVFSTLALPRFAQSQNDDAALREGIVKLLRALTLVTFPLLFGLAATAHIFIPVVYGPGWDRAVALVWLLTGMGLLKTIGNIGGAVIIAKGQVKTGLVWNCIIAGCNTVVFLFVVRYGVGALSAVYSVLSLVYLLLSFRSYYGVTIGLSLRAYASSFWLSTLFSALMAAVVYGVYLLLAGEHLQPFIELMLLVGLGVTVYSVVNILVSRKELTDLFLGARDRRMS
jgi:O-antigen/teichoic acid export membrane protein